MREPSGVYVTALFTRLMMTCMIRRPSIWAMSSGSSTSTRTSCSAALRFRWWNASRITSSTSSGSVLSVMVPLSSRVTTSRFSTRFTSHSASS